MSPRKQEQERENRLQRLINSSRVVKDDAEQVLSSIKEVRRVERLVEQGHRRGQEE